MNALNQLCIYMRLMFREQLDRRFAIGITLCLDRLAVYLCDRSGILGIKEYIDIHNVGPNYPYLTSNSASIHRIQKLSSRSLPAFHF